MQVPLMGSEKESGFSYRAETTLIKQAQAGNQESLNLLLHPWQTGQQVQTVPVQLFYWKWALGQQTVQPNNCLSGIWILFRKKERYHRTKCQGF